MSKKYTLREAKLILKNRALKKTIAILRDQSSEMRRAFLDIQEVIRNNDKDAEIKRLNAAIDRTVNAWESRCIEKCDEIKRLNSVIDELKPYRDGYDPEEVFPPEGEWVWLRDCDDNFEQVQYDRKMEWYWNYGYNAESFTTWDRFNGDLRRWYPIGKLPEVQE